MNVVQPGHSVSQSCIAQAPYRTNVVGYRSRINESVFDVYAMRIEDADHVTDRKSRDPTAKRRRRRRRRASCDEPPKNDDDDDDGLFTVVV